MDNNTFETEMINTVNANAKTASAKREAKDIKRKKTNKAKAIVEMLCWMLFFVATAYSVYVFSWLGYIPAGYAIAIPSCVGYVAGFRASGLVKLI